MSCFCVSCHLLSAAWKIEKAPEHPAVPQVRVCGIPLITGLASWCGPGLVAPVLGDKLCKAADGNS